MDQPSLFSDDLFASPQDETLSLAQMLLDAAAAEEAPGATLSKSRFLAGLQCKKRLALEVLHPDLRDPVDTAVTTVRRLGAELGEMARERWPDGVLVHLRPEDPQQAVRQTRTAMANPDVPAIFEATVLANGRLAATDILERQADGSWAIGEVKSGSKVSDWYMQDIAFQWRAFQAAGIPVSKAQFYLPNKEYVVGKKNVIDPQQLFAVVDVTDQVQTLQPQIDATFRQQQALLAARTVPAEPMGKHCDTPRPCPFTGHCTRQAAAARTTPEPKHPLTQLYRLSASRLEKLQELGVTEIGDLPADADLTETQARQREVIRTGVPYRNVAGIAKDLEGLEWPLHFLDFEAINPAVPLFPGTSPYQVVPIQFSNHTMDAAGRTIHKEYLHATDKDPREPFLKKLLSAVKDKGSIVVYSGYEATRLKALAKELPQYAPQIEDLLKRLIDLLPIVRNHTYHPGYAGSFSIKKVLPVWVEDLSYKNLTIQNGDAAVVAFMEMMHPDTPPTRRVQIGADLRAYCGTDTMAMVRLALEIAKEPLAQAQETARMEAKARRRGRSVTPNSTESPVLSSSHIVISSESEPLAVTPAADLGPAEDRTTLRKTPKHLEVAAAAAATPASEGEPAREGTIAVVTEDQMGATTAKATAPAGGAVGASSDRSEGEPLPSKPRGRTAR